MSVHQAEKLICYLKSEYAAKLQKIECLQQEVVTIQTLIDKQLTSTLRSDKENDSMEFYQDVDSAIGISRKLQKITSDLGWIQTDDSKEHRYLEYMQRHLSIAAASGEVNQQLLETVTDLNGVHENLCRNKEEVENLINKAYRRQAKNQITLSQNHSASSDASGRPTDPWLDDFVRKHVNLDKRFRSPKSPLKRTPFTPRNDGK